MKIISTYAPAVFDAELGKDVVYAVYDTFVDGKSLVVGLTVGSMDGKALEDVKVSPVGQRVLNRMGEYHNFRYPHGLVVIAGVASRSSAAQRVGKVLTDAPHEAAVLLLCADDKVYDKAFTALNVDLQSMKTQPQ